MLLLGLVRVMLGLVVLLVLLLLMLQPRRISLRILVLMGEDVLRLRLKHGGPTETRARLGRGTRNPQENGVGIAAVRPSQGSERKVRGQRLECCQELPRGDSLMDDRSG